MWVSYFLSFLASCYNMPTHNKLNPANSNAHQNEFALKATCELRCCFVTLHSQASIFGYTGYYFRKMESKNRFFLHLNLKFQKVMAFCDWKKLKKGKGLKWP